jgi:NitT/TauT family transport system ATP-binding protein
MIFVTHSIEEAVLLGHRVIVLKGRPSSIYETITIELPNPRTRETLREPRFAELREQVWARCCGRRAKPNSFSNAKK